MYKIGEFAKLVNVSVRLLHHYDEIDLFKPAMTGGGIGYRYYAVEQLPQIYRILALRDLGLSLEEIKYLLHENVSISDIRGMLLLKRAELHRHIAETTARLEQVESRLDHLEREGKMPEHDLIFKSVAPVRVLSLREAVPPETSISHLYYETYGALKAHDLHRCIKGRLTVYHTSYPHPHLVDGKRIIEICYVIDDPNLASITLGDNRRMNVCQLPEIDKAACIIDQTPDQHRYLAYRLMWQWVKNNSHQLAMPLRECYLKRSQQQMVTEIQFPIK